MRLSSSLAVALAAFSSSVVAHPGHDVAAEALEQRAFLNGVERKSLAHCAETLKARGHEERSVRRRAALIEKARQKRGIVKRDLDDALNTSHDKTDLGYTPNTDADTLFGSNNSCILAPDVTQGPYYVGGEYVRRDVTDGQEGVPTTIYYQAIDVDTCEPIPDLYVELWHCNATGVYSGVVASGNGDSSEQSNLDATFLRGIQPTDEDGVAEFETVFPGHYTGRAIHIHLMAHANATLLANQTLGNDIYSSHIGQAFFDQDLITEVEKTSPYSTNTQELTLNEDDSIMSESAAGDSDPVHQYVLLGDDVSEGVFAWFSFGINTTVSDHITPAAFLYEEGGVTNDDADMGGPGGGNGGGPPGGNGTMPSMPPPEGTSDVTESASPSSTGASDNGSGKSCKAKARKARRN